MAIPGARGWAGAVCRGAGAAGTRTGDEAGRGRDRMDRSSPDTMATGMGAAAAEPAAGGTGRGARLAAWVRAHLPGRRGRHERWRERALDGQGVSLSDWKAGATPQPWPRRDSGQD